MIRPAHALDRPRLLYLALSFAAESAYARFVNANPGQVGRYVDFVLERGAFFVAEREGEIVGFIAGFLAQEHPVSGECIASECAWYVEPQHRHGTLGVRLLDAFEGWALSHGAERVEMIAPYASDVGAFYQRRGYEPVETVYQRRVA